MSKSDLPTRVSNGAGPREAAPLRTARLDELAPGRSVRLVRVPEETRGTLAQEGLVEGAEMTVERRVGLGGPVIVRVGRTRVAVARAVARLMEVEDGVA